VAYCADNGHKWKQEYTDIYNKAINDECSIVLTGGGRKMGKTAWEEDCAKVSDIVKAEAHIAKIKEEERKAKEAHMPNFKRYTEKWPLGPTGSFYNSMGKMCNIKEMKTPYIKSTRTWLDNNFNFGLTSHGFAVNKYEELSKELIRRDNEGTAYSSRSKRPNHTAVKSKRDGQDGWDRWR
jgi:hypothetical protein